MAGSIIPIHNGRLEGPLDLNHLDFLNDDGVTTFIRTAGSYANPTWITALGWTKITGAPSTFTPTAHATSHVNGGSDPVVLAISQTMGLQTALDLKSPLVSPTFAGVPLAPTAAAATNTTQIATTAFVTSAISSAVSGMLNFKGTTNCSANPNYPSAIKGDAYIVSVAGKIGGASGTFVDVGDWYIAEVDNAGGTETSVGASWGHMEHNLVGALLASNNLADLENTTTARSNLGVVIGTNVQAYNATLTTWAATTPPSSYAVGDLLYASAANVLSKLADVATGSVLLSGGVTTSPLWGKVTTSHTTGIAANGANGDITALSGITGNIAVATTSIIKWGTDLGLARNAAGILEVNTSLAGQWAPLKLGNRDSGTTSVTDAIILGHQSTGTPGVGFGTALMFNLDSSTTPDQNAGRIYVQWSVATHASRTSKVGIQTVNNAGALADVVTFSGDKSTAFSGLVRTANATSSGVADPSALNQGGTYNNTTNGDVSKAKYKLYDDGTNQDGISLSSVGGGFTQMEYMTHTSVDHAWYIAGVEIFRIATARLSLSKPMKLKAYTVATLPTGQEGDEAYVTDALTPAFLSTVVGGGSVRTPVFYNGTNWVGS